jgi:hypothetical protein
VSLLWHSAISLFERSCRSLQHFQGREIYAQEIHNRNTFLGDSKLSNILIRFTQNVRKMEFFKIYSSEKHTNKTDLKHSWRFYQVKIKLFLCAPRSHRWSWCIAPLILNLTTRWMVTITPWSFYPSESTPVPIEYDTGWASETSGSFEDVRILPPLPGFEPWTAQPAA